jgi:hypothetical protein|nr:MAG TPA: hypothetical protein [Caudoviricetes sp.]
MTTIKRVKYPIVASTKVHENDMATAVIHLPCDTKTRNDYHEKAMIIHAGDLEELANRVQKVIEAFKVEIE